MPEELVLLHALRVEWDGTSVAVIVALTPDGDEVRIAAEPRLAQDVEAALAAGEDVPLDVEGWQVIAG